MVKPEGVKDVKTVMVKTENCVGCRHCELACSLEHSSLDNTYELFQQKPPLSARIDVRTGIDLLNFPLRCQHCDPAPCLEICPSGAISRDRPTETVQVNDDDCISCGMCAMVCPYSAITFPVYREKMPGTEKVKASAYKCDDCLERRQEGDIPACTEACRTGALEFGEIDEMVSADRDELAVLLTAEASGKRSERRPKNMEKYRELKLKMAGLGPFPASRKEE